MVVLQNGFSLTTALRGAAKMTRRSSTKLNPRTLERRVRLVGRDTRPGLSAHTNPVNTSALDTDGTGSTISIERTSITVSAV